MQLLGLQKRTQSLQVQQIAEARGRMALAAPHEGVFVLGRNWSGERIKVGDNLWSGQTIGELPDLSTMEALIRVLESEMSGVTVGTLATVELDARPGVSFRGKVKSVSAVASPIDRESPLKYFDVTVAFDDPDPELMNPGLSARATLHVKRQENVIAIPNQAVFHKGDETWVWVERGSGYDRRPVKTGDRSPTRTVIVEGLMPGDRIALGDPDKRPAGTTS
jgi:RND family efflux transporter MFP subunit